MDISTLSRTELLQVADAVAREKSIEREEVLEAMEQAIGKAGRAKYGQEHDIRAEIDRKTGEISLRRFREVVEEIDNEFTQLTVEDASFRQPGSSLGDFVVEELPPIDLGRIAAQTAKQVIVQKVREAERAATVRGVQGPHRRDHQRHRQAQRVRQRDCRPRPRRGPDAPGRDPAARIVPHRRSGSAPTSTMCARNRAVRRSSCRAPIRSSWPSCSPKRCRRSTTRIIEIKAVARDPGSRAKIGVISQ